MELDDDGKIVTYNRETDDYREPEGVDAINDILDKLREVNKEHEVWDKLSGLKESEIGFGLYYPKKDK